MSDMHGWRISVDTGGTFTDVVIADHLGHFTIGKALTTPERIFEGLRAAIENAAATLNLELGDVLKRTDILIYGTTRATNAIVTGNIAKTAFLTTAGFPDVLVLREGGKFNPHDFSKPYPPPYVPRRNTFEIEERIDASGNIVVPLNEPQTRATLQKLAARGFEAIAVSFLWSIAHAAHELRVGELIAELLPGIPFTLGHQLNPILREYRRASSAAIDVSIKPLMQAHLNDLRQDLRAAGYRGEILVSTTIGGCLDIDSVVARPIHTVRSGPAMGPIAGRHYAGLEGEHEAALVVDTGGTTFDVSLVREDRIAITQETWLGEQFTGYMLGIPAVDARSVGAGGGSIAWLDSAGLLHVGPRSAGAKPGPACYRMGGQEPTVTDAALALGYIDPEYFLGGRMRLDLDAARRALQRVAEPLGISIEAAAYSIFVVANETMINAIKDITVSVGIDPSEAVIVAGGGAAGFSILPIARELHCRRVIVPRTASVLSACGMQFSDIQFEQSASLPTRSTHFAREAVNHMLRALAQQLEEAAAPLAARGFGERRLSFRVDAHYAAQVWDISVDLAGDSLADEIAVKRLIDDFHANHRRVFNVDDPASPIEFLNWTGRLSIALPATAAGAHATSAAKAAQANTRMAFFDVDQACTARVYRGERITSGMSIAGPAIIEEATTTIVLPPGTVARLSPHHSFVVDWLE